jgi:hypothetical protein
MRPSLSLLVHGESGVGKSWLADTVPAPRLVLDAEGRAQYTPSGPKVYWDPRQSGPPAYDGTWETCIVNVVDFETLSTAYKWLRSGQHQFVSVVIDSLMEAQKRCQDAIAGSNAFDQQDWGTLLRKLEELIRQYRDLKLLPNNTASCIVFICGSVSADGKQRPLLQGALKDTNPYYFDVVGYYFKQPIQGADGILQGYQRSLLVDSIPGFVAKDGTDRFIRTYPDGYIPVPNIEQMMSLLQPQQLAAVEGSVA